MTEKETSAVISTIASAILHRKPARGTMINATDYNDLLHDAQRVAASALSQDETPGQK